jgi:hypothetical protein
MIQPFKTKSMNEIEEYDTKQFEGVYRYTDYNNNGQEYFLIILKSGKALLLYEQSKERINLNNILDVYEGSYGTFEEMAENFKSRVNESTLNLFSVRHVEDSDIYLSSTYNQIQGLPFYQCLQIEAHFFPSYIPSMQPFLNLDLFSSHKETKDSKNAERIKTLAGVSFTKFK